MITPSEGQRLPALKVFISSTVEDLKKYRAAARDAALNAHIEPTMVEYWVARGDKPPLEECLRRVSEAQVLVVIAAHRYGWVPQDQPKGEYKSISWLECERAAHEGREVLAFIVDEKVKWSAELKEQHRLAEAAAKGKKVPRPLVAEVERNVANLQQFKQWLGKGGIRKTFTSPADLGGKVEGALREWRDRYLSRPPETAGGRAEQVKEAQPDLTPYLRWLREETGWIDIRGLQVGTGEARRFRVEQLYITLATTGVGVSVRFTLTLPGSGLKRERGSEGPRPAADIGSARFPKKRESGGRSDFSSKKRSIAALSSAATTKLASGISPSRSIWPPEPWPDWLTAPGTRYCWPVTSCTFRSGAKR